MRYNTTWLIFLCALTLITTGVVMVYSSSAAIAVRNETKKSLEQQKEAGSIEGILNFSAHSSSFAVKQGIFALLGIGVILVACRIDYEIYKKYASPLLWGTFFLLLLVYVPGIGKEVNGARRWLNLGIQIQVSELAKLAMIIYMAKKLSENQGEIKTFRKGFLSNLIVLGLFAGAIVLEPDLGATVILCVITYAIWFVGGMRLTHLFSVAVAAVPLLAVAIIAEPFRVRRLLAFMDPLQNKRGDGWQLWQSLVSVGTGGVTGLGLGQGPQKYQFLSEGYTDFIYSGICEELGMVGGVFIFCVYAFFMIQGIRVANKAPDLYGTLIATGITIMIGIQAFFNMYVATGLVPTKGLTLPMISYGISSLLINCMAVGILMNISRYTETIGANNRAIVKS